jgi:signal recognition particle receptor subunit alpha
MNSVSQSVLGHSLSTFERVSTVVNTALESSVGRILTPKQDLDLVRNIQESQKKNKPYVIVFVGINGVGKSTSLAKVCYHLLQKSFRPLIAACDTFRSGAVEQLKVHADCLGVDVFEQGYASDSSKVAQSAITHATREGHDVVLVDTAGRMQNNKPHMVALSAVITVNNPDLILFVGEALAGNDAIDQMTQFNQALKDHARSNRPRLIDGIVLTKFDCVDDKVGTAVSMVHKTATPIMFVGTGQKYTHLRKLNVEDVLHKLIVE